MDEIFDVNYIIFCFVVSSTLSFHNFWLVQFSIVYFAKSVQYTKAPWQTNYLLTSVFEVFLCLFSFSRPCVTGLSRDQSHEGN